MEGFNSLNPSFQKGVFIDRRRNNIMAEPEYRAYDPHLVEEKWYRFWEEKGFFHANPESNKPPYCIVIPPPNITGSLHMGHALNNTLQDILVRWKRMQGYNVLWLPGTDHAGIATQNVVERQLQQEGLDRRKVGREEFLRRVWKWKEESGGTIIHQLKKLGSSCDWERERFTMDAGLSEAVKEVFIRLYENGLIYQGDYIINWCPRCQTALSDLEVEYQEVKGKLYYIRYPGVSGNGGVIVATTRPETMLGDTAVAVHPEDARYKDLKGKEVILPIMEREIPVISDPYVDMEFGTGAVKVTPAHDPRDFEAGLRHGLPQVKVIGEDGTMTSAAGKYQGMGRFACREQLVRDLEQGGYLQKVEDHMHAVGHCYRCQTVIEPTLSRQWFVRMKPLAEPAIKAVLKGRVRIIPEQWEKTYFQWMRNIRDWCISRQIWWGHRIPAWYCDDCQEVIVSRGEPKECLKCGSVNLRQEDDVLDTWFSSALWPFSTLGWPESTPDLKCFYPTSVLVTGFDILFFWVARMIMMGLRFMGEVPFREVYIHALVRDAGGQKMSKSKGNIIDPLLMIDRYGADAFRFTLAALAVQGRDIRMAEERIEGYRHFSNKIWNAKRFVLINLNGRKGCKGLSDLKLDLADRWLLSRLQEVIHEVNGALEAYSFNEAASALYQFLWHEYCDWYLEMVKARLSEDGDEESKEASRYLMAHVLEVFLRLLHPFMPFISEDIWQTLPHEGESIMVAPWPEADPSWISPEATETMETVIEIVRAVRNFRSEMNIPLAKKLRLVVKAKDEATLSTLEASLKYIKSLARLGELEFGIDVQAPPSSAIMIVKGMEAFIPLEGLVDFDKEKVRIERELERLEQEISRITKKLANEDHLQKAPEDVVAREKASRKELLEAQLRLQQNLRIIETQLKKKS